MTKGKEFSAGAIVFRRKGEQVLFLLIKSRRHRTWGFPKGHLEPGESERDACLREVQEETGLTDLAFFPGYREEAVYTTVSNRGMYKGQEIEKHAVYFLCQTTQKDIVVDAAEITEYQWADPVAAETLITFGALVDIFRKAVDRASGDS